MNTESASKCGWASQNGNCNEDLEQPFSQAIEKSPGIRDIAEESQDICAEVEGGEVRKATSAPIPPTGSRLFSARAIFWFTLCFGPLAGGFMTAANWFRLGQSQKAHSVILSAFVTLIAMGVVSTFATAVPALAVLALFAQWSVPYLLWGYVRENHRVALQSQKEAGVPTAGIGKPLAICIAIVFLLGLGGLSATDAESDSGSSAADQETAAEMYQYSTELEMSGDYTSAIEGYHTIDELLKDSPVPTSRIASSYYELGQYDSATTYWQITIMRDPESADARFELAKSLYATSNYEDCLKQLDEVERLGGSVDPAIREMIMEDINAGSRYAM